MTDLEITKPVKLLITAFLDSAFTRPLRPAPNRMTAAYSPDTLKIRQENTYESKQGVSTSASQSGFYASRSRQLSLTLSFIGIDFGRYGPSKILKAEQQDVAKNVDLFLRLCQQINGQTHEPSYLRLNWAQGGVRSTFEARLLSYDLNYSLFDRNSKPLQADISATFVEAVQPRKQRARSRLSSPDLSHRHLVLAGETLPMLCLRYYGTPDLYLKIAAFNQLDDLRSLIPGTELLFPPLATSGGQE